jgi:hypothetical protein
LLAQLTNDIPSGGGSPFAGQGAKVGRDLTENANSGANLTVTFTEEVYDDLNMVDLGAQPQRVTIPTTNPQITRVLVSLYSDWQNNNSGDRTMSITINGVFGYNDNLSQIRYRPPANNLAGFQAIYTWPYEVIAGDFFGVVVRQDSGSPLGHRCWLTVTVLQ